MSRDGGAIARESRATEMGDPPPFTAADRLTHLRRFATDAVSFQGLKTRMLWWVDPAPPAAAAAAVPYTVSGGSWVAVGAPLIDRERRGHAVRRFTEAARSHCRRAVFFGVEDLEPFDGYRRVLLGMQSELRPSQWPATLALRTSLREQLRRARAKGVTVRRSSADALRQDDSLRQAVTALGAQWLATKPMEPMGFLVSAEPFVAADEHIYLIAEWQGRPVLFLSAVPIYQRHGWLIEDVFRARNAPNGTTELVIDCLMRELRGDPHWTTSGLTPLAGPVPLWLQMVRTVTAPLYDFGGLRRFRSRLRPTRWAPVWLVWDRGALPCVLLDVLRAFAHGRLLAFAGRSLVGHAHGPPWLVALPLVPWTVMLTALAVSGHSPVLGYSTAGLSAWIAFDVALCWGLFHAARRPRLRRMTALTLLASADAVLSWRHVALSGLSSALAAAALRALAVLGPILGTAFLAWATWLARRGPRQPRPVSEAASASR